MSRHSGDNGWGILVIGCKKTVTQNLQGNKIGHYVLLK